MEQGRNKCLTRDTSSQSGIHVYQIKPKYLKGYKRYGGNKVSF